MRLIWKYVRQQWALASLGPACVLVEVWAELRQPELMACIVDQGILGGRPDVIAPTGISMAILIAVGVVCGLLSIVSAGKVSHRLGKALKAELFRHIMALPAAEIGRFEAASLITRMSDDVVRVQQVVQASMRLLFRAPFLFVGAVVMALLINVRVSVVIVAVMVASSLFLVTTLKRTFPFFLVLQGRRDRLSAVVQETLGGIRVAKAYTNEDIESRKFADANGALVEDSIAMGRTLSLMMPVVGLALNIGTILVIYFGAGEAELGRMQVGGIMAAINYLAQIQIAVMMAQHVIVSITQAKASIQRIEEVLAVRTIDEADALKATPGCSPMPFVNGDIVFSNVSFAHDGVKVIDGVSLSLRKGGTLGITGETGSGKSSLVKLLNRLYDADSGSVTIGGTDVTRFNREDLMARVALLQQRPLLFSGTLRQNISMGNPSISDHDIMAAAKAAEIADFIVSHPDGLDLMVAQGGTNLSGGQRQRICLARALVTKPDILIVDDALSALDALTERRIRAMLQELDCTKIIVSQRISSISAADTIVVMSAGRVVDLGTHEQLMASCVSYRETCEAQSR